MKITFCLPGPERRPAGGPRIVYEYANRLAEKGHQITVLHTTMILPEYSMYSDEDFRKIAVLWLENPGPWGFSPSWFSFSRPVAMHVIPRICDAYVPDGDAVIATWWSTAYGVNSLSAAKGKQWHLVQHHEIWGGSKEWLTKAYTMPSGKLAVSKWLCRVMREYGANEVHHVPNAIDLQHFCCWRRPEERFGASVLMLYHEQEWKGVQEGLAAIELVKKNYPELKVTLFGVFPRPDSLPSWIGYVRNPSPEQLVALYNEHAVFVSPSWAEGFCLPGAEAMACGCALVATGSGGIFDYAVQGETALLSRPRDVENLAKHVEALIRHPEARTALAKRGHQCIQAFHWAASVNRMEAILAGKENPL